MIKKIYLLLPALLPLAAAAQDSAPAEKAWITRSNSITAAVIDIDKKYTPEFGSQQGLAEYDTLISVPTRANQVAARKDREALAVSLKDKLQQETDPLVKQDIEIL
ncbi:MAG TPA: hypothetical protein VGC22_06080, partial [Chitinophaga sp.]